MSMIQIRDVPEPLHRKLKARAALAGQSLSDYLLAEIKKTLDRPTREELLARVRSRSRVALDESAADALHAERALR
jgi:plasmid stability protein